jgi:hypothetical protein
MVAVEGDFPSCHTPIDDPQVRLAAGDNRFQLASWFVRPAADIADAAFLTGGGRLAWGFLWQAPNLDAVLLALEPLRIESFSSDRRRV